MLTTAPQFRWHLGSSVGTYQVPLPTLALGTQRVKVTQSTSPFPYPPPEAKDLLNPSKS